MSSLQASADHLDILQSKENYGRGVSCIKTLVHYLRIGDQAAATAVANNEWDKIASYPDIAEYVKKIGLVSADAYVTRY